MENRTSQYFESHPGVDEFHFTTDGQAFLSKDKAQMHASKLHSQKQKIKTVTRKEYEVEVEKMAAQKDAAEKAETEKAAADKAATEKMAAQKNAAEKAETEKAAADKGATDKTAEAEKKNVKKQ